MRDLAEWTTKALVGYSDEFPNLALIYKAPGFIKQDRLRKRRLEFCQLFYDNWLIPRPASSCDRTFEVNSIALSKTRYLIRNGQRKQAHRFCANRPH